MQLTQKKALPPVCMNILSFTQVMSNYPTATFMLFANLIVLVFTIVRFLLFLNAAQHTMHPGRNWVLK